MIRRVYENIEGFRARVEPKYQQMLACKAGCDMCCHQDLTVFPVEAQRVADYVATLDPDVRKRAWIRAQRGEHCAFLLDGLCAVYPVRPTICRTHGLPVWVESHADCCPLNFPDGSLSEVPKSDLLDVERLNMVLAAVEMARAKAEGTGSDRVRLADLAIVEK